MVASPKVATSPTVFVSYSWDSDEHKDWVRLLAIQLQANGVTVLIDQWDLKAGFDLPAFMESSVRDSDFVLLICTPEFAQRANGLKGGVGYEKAVVTGEIFNGAQPGKFVPLLRHGDTSASIPSYLKSKFSSTSGSTVPSMRAWNHFSDTYMPSPASHDRRLGTSPSFHPGRQI